MIVFQQREFSYMQVLDVSQLFQPLVEGSKEIGSLDMPWCHTKGINIGSCNGNSLSTNIHQTKKHLHVHGKHLCGRISLFGRYQIQRQTTNRLVDRVGVLWSPKLYPQCPQHPLNTIDCQSILPPATLVMVQIICVLFFISISLEYIYLADSFEILI